VAQQDRAPARIGLILNSALPPAQQTAAGQGTPALDAFRQGLRDLGYIEGQNLILEVRYGAGQVEKFPELVADLVKLKVDVLAMTGAGTARAAKKVTGDVPMVAAMVVDPVADGVVGDRLHPGGNITAITSFDPMQSSKQISLLKEVVPGLRRLAILDDAGVSDALFNLAAAAAQAQGLESVRWRLQGATPDLEGAFSAFATSRVEALLVLEVPITVAHRKRIAQMAAAQRLPAMFGRDQVDAGGVLAYGTGALGAVKRMPVYVDKILNGAKPGDLPVEAVTTYDLVVNLKAAKDVDLVVPPEVLKRASRVIE
jgi:putative ABC transport system substrate-binding protein